ncbi:MAG: DUF2225 domain-containing protein [Desulfocucumaceae bacterium]
MNNDIADFLRGIPFFNSLSPILLARLSEKTTSLKFSKGKIVLGEGKNCNNLFITTLGRLEVFKKVDSETELILQTLGRGGVFGELYILDGSTTDAGLRAAEDSTVLCIERMIILSLIKENQEFSKGYMRYLCNIARDSTTKVELFLKTFIEEGIDLPDPYALSRQGDDKKEKPAPAPIENNSITTNGNPGEESGDADEMFFKKEYSCPLCEERFGTLKPRQKFIIIDRTDDDFCMHYKTINPLFYEINVCPKCGYSFNNSSFGAVKADIRSSLKKKIAEYWDSVNYCGIRTQEAAVDIFKLAIECQKARGLDATVMGKLYLKLGWLYRYMGIKEEELNNLEIALNHLNKSFENGTAEGPKEEMNLMFLIGQLNRIIGNDREAVNWFARVTQHPDKKIYPYIVNLARDTWQEIRRA